MITKNTLSTFAQDVEPRSVRVSHGPMSGRTTDHSITVWVRTKIYGDVRAFYRTDEKTLDKSSPVLASSIDHYNTGTVTIDEFEAETEYLRFESACMQINNVVNHPLVKDGEHSFVAPHPQVMFQFFDAFTGELRYSETIVKGMEKG